MLKTIFIIFLSLCIAHTSYGINANDSVSIYFGVGEWHLSPAAKKTIDSLLYNDILAPGRRVGIIGYADNVGAESTNQKLSEQRASAVQQYLLYMHFDSLEIESVTGKGAVSRAANQSGYPLDRRVVIIPGGFNKKAKPNYGKTIKLGDAIHYVDNKPVIDIDQVQVNTLFKLDRVYFAMGKSDLLESSKPMLNALYILMRDNPELKIQVEGHVCCAKPYKIENNTKVFLKEGEVDTATYAPRSDLSVYRAASVYSYLVYEKHIDASRIKYVGYGVKHMLVSPEVTDEDRAANRRVEIRILSK